MLKAALKTFGKIIVSGIIALVILTLLCFFYSSTPLPTANEDGSTNLKTEANAYYFYGEEGFGWGKTNNDGFPNMFDYGGNMEIDVLIMGSSHMEAFQVPLCQSTASLLNALLRDETVYNIGASGHRLLICSGNLRAALKKYQPTKYVIMETFEVSFSNEAIAFAISEEDTSKRPNHTSGFIGLLKKSPYLRLMYGRIKEYITSLQADDVEDEEKLEALTVSDIVSNENLLNNLLHKVNVLAGEYGSKVIIVYHPSISIAPDGTLNLNADQDEITRFKQLCDTNGILFLDMSSRFKEEYESSYILPYGFPNSPVGSGHLNKYGHAMMADELYSLILEDEP